MTKWKRVTFIGSELCSEEFLERACGGRFEAWALATVSSQLRACGGRFVDGKFKMVIYRTWTKPGYYTIEIDIPALWPRLDETDFVGGPGYGSRALEVGNAD